jgi:uncharacterized protein YjbJ (UPF0337 family)
MLPRAPAQTGAAFQKDQEIRSMNKTIFEGKWKEIRGKSKEWWSLINDLDLSRVDKAAIKLDKYVVLLQVKYGYTKQYAREEINKHMEQHEAEEMEKNVSAS